MTFETSDNEIKELESRIHSLEKDVKANTRKMIWHDNLMGFLFGLAILCTYLIFKEHTTLF